MEEEEVDRERRRRAALLDFADFADDVLPLLDAGRELFFDCFVLSCELDFLEAVVALATDLADFKPLATDVVVAVVPVTAVFTLWLARVESARLTGSTSTTTGVADLLTPDLVLGMDSIPRDFGRASGPTAA